jgi:hypothetical protein
LTQELVTVLCKHEDSEIKRILTTVTQLALAKSETFKASKKTDILNLFCPQNEELQRESKDEIQTFWALADASLNCISILQENYVLLKNLQTKQETGNQTTLLLQNNGATDDSGGSSSSLPVTKQSANQLTTFEYSDNVLANIRHNMETELSGGNLLRYHEEFRNIAENEAIQRFPDNEDEQREFKKEQLGVFMKMVDIRVVKVQMLQREALANRHEENQKRAHDATLAIRKKHHKQANDVAKRVAALKEHQIRAADKAALERRKDLKKKRLKDANKSVSERRENVMHLLMKAQCIILFALSTAAVMQARVSDITNCGQAEMTRVIFGNTYQM